MIRSRSEYLGWQAMSVRRLSPLSSRISTCAGASTISVPVDLVDELALDGGEDDLVAGLELVDVVERLAVGGAVAGDGHVALLAGQRGLGVVARAPGELVDAVPSTTVRVTPMAGISIWADRVALAGAAGPGATAAGTDADGERSGPGPWWWCAVVVGAVGGGRGRAGHDVGELVAERVLRPGLLQAGAPELVRHEQQDQRPRRHQRPADSTEDLREHGARDA